MMFKKKLFIVDVCLLCEQDIVLLLEDQMKPLVQAELSVLVDVLHQPELLISSSFPPDSRIQSKSDGFISR